MDIKETSKLTIIRFFISLAIIFFVALPWYKFNIIWPSYMFGGKVIIELNYILATILLLLFLIIYFIDSKRSKGLNDIIYKILIDGLLMTFAFNHNIGLIIPLIVIIRDILVLGHNNIKSTSLDRISNIVMIIGIFFVLVGNIPFELLNLAVDQGLILIATCIKVYQGCLYFLMSKANSEVE